MKPSPLAMVIFLFSPLAGEFPSPSPDSVSDRKKKPQRLAFSTSGSTSLAFSLILFQTA
jgi:hypothetical protein